RSASRNPGIVETIVVHRGEVVAHEHTLQLLNVCVLNGGIRQFRSAVARAASALARENVEPAQLPAPNLTSPIPETSKLPVVWNKCGLVHLDGDAKEQREVVLHLRVRAGGIRDGQGRIPPPVVEGLLNQCRVSDR